jgi:hypothetical protein
LKKIDWFRATQHFNNLCCLFLFGASKDKEFHEYSLTFDPFIYLESLEKVGFATFKNLVNLQLFIAITLMNIQVSYVA